MLKDEELYRASSGPAPALGLSMCSSKLSTFEVQGYLALFIVVRLKTPSRALDYKYR